MTTTTTTTCNKSQQQTKQLTHTQATTTDKNIRIVQINISKKHNKLKLADTIYNPPPTQWERKQKTHNIQDTKHCKLHAHLH